MPPFINTFIYSKPLEFSQAVQTLYLRDVFWFSMIRKPTLIDS